MILYAGNISNLTDARYFSAWNVDWLGFRMSDIPSIEHLRGLIEWVEGPEFLLELGVPELHLLREDLGESGISGAVLPAELAPSGLDLSPGISIIASLVISADRTEREIWDILEPWKAVSDTVVLDFISNGIPVRESRYRKMIGELGRNFRVILGYFPPEEFSPGVTEELGIAGLYLPGGEEEKTGVKSFETWDELLEQVTEF